MSNQVFYFIKHIDLQIPPKGILCFQVINMETCKCCQKKNPRDEEMTKNLKTRINRIIGQLNGVNKMLDDNRYCHDILIQIAAVESALKEVGFIILQDHMMTCVSDDIKNNDYQSLIDALEITKKLK